MNSAVSIHLISGEKPLNVGLGAHIREITLDELKLVSLFILECIVYYNIDIIVQLMLFILYDHCY